MGMFQVAVTVANPRDPAQTFQEPFWVDTGAFHSFAPEDRLHQIGLTPLKTREFVLADGRRDRRLIGEAVLALTVNGVQETATCQVVFGPVGSLYLLGASALEAFTVQPDPIAQVLRPITVVIAARI